MSNNLLEIIGTEWRRFVRWCGYAIVIFVPSPCYAQSGAKDSEATTIILLALGLALYFLPSIIAKNRNHRNRRAITALNFVLGWTLVGWIAALVWSLTADTEEKPLSVPVGGLLELLPAERKRREALREQMQIEKERREGVFRPDGMVGDTPYRALLNGEVEALIQGGNVRFQSLDQLRSMMNVKGPAQDREKSRATQFRFPRRG